MEEAWCKSGVRDKSQNVRIIYTHAMARDHVRLVFFFFQLEASLLVLVVSHKAMNR